MRGRGPDLLAVDDVMVAFAPRRGFDRRQIRARPRLGEALAPPIVEIGGARQEAPLLLVAAELDQHGAEHRDIARVALRRREGLDLFQEHHALDRRPAWPAPFLWPVEGRPGLLVQDALPADEVRLFDLVPELQFLADVVRQVVADKAAHLLAKSKLFGAETEIHRGRSSVRRI